MGNVPKIAIIVLLLLFFPALSIAVEDKRDFAVLQLLTKAYQREDYIQARQYVSSNSQPLFDRYSKYNLGSLTSSHISLNSESEKGRYRYLKVAGSNQLNNAAKAMTVAIVTEDNDSKIDLEETLRLGFGPNWQQKLDLMEQTYNLSRQYLGEAQSLQILNTMLTKQSVKSSSR